MSLRKTRKDISKFAADEPAITWNMPRHVKIQDIVLQTLYVCGVISIALLAPNALQIIKLFEGDRVRKTNPRRSIERASRRLYEKGYVTVSNESGSQNGAISLTPEGKKHLLRRKLTYYISEQPKRWDGKWRIIMFDIHEQYREERHVLRRSLSSAGFVKLQNSVWVYPYESRGLLALLRSYLDVERQVIYLTVLEIENDSSLRKHFRLDQKIPVVTS